MDWIVKVRRLLCTLAVQLARVVALICVPLHIATYFAVLTLKSVLLPLALIFTAALFFVLSGNPFRNLRRPSPNWMRFHVVLAIYAVTVTLAYYFTVDG